MSDIYIRRLQQVQSEYDALKGSLQLTQIWWNKYGVEHLIPGVTPIDIQRAVENLEAIVFIRLFSVFEGLLKEHLVQYHTSISLPEEARVVWLIDHVARCQPIRITPVLRTRVHEVRQYRNALVHAGRGTPPNILFAAALGRLSKFVSRLPEPR